MTWHFSRVWLLMGLALVGCGGGAVTPAMLSAAQKRWPDATQQSLEAGRGLFTEKCHECHAQPNPKDHTAQEWPKLLDKMAKLAKLSDDGKESVLRYVLAARDAE